MLLYSVLFADMNALERCKGALYSVRCSVCEI